MFFRRTMPVAEFGRDEEPTSSMTTMSGSSTTSSGRLGPRFHYLGDSQFEITSSLKGYNFQRPRADSIYKTAILSHDDEDGTVVKWRVIRWLLMLIFVLFLLGATIYSVLWLTEQQPKEVLNSTTVFIPNELLINLETQRNLPPPAGLLEAEIDIPVPLDDLQSIDGGDSQEDNKTTSPLDEEVSFIDRLISSFNNGQTRRPTTQPQDPDGITVKQLTSLGETGYVRHLPNGHKYGEYQSVPSMTKFLALSTTSPRLPVSPTLPSIRPKGYEQSTEGAPSNASDSACHSPQLSMCRGVIPWDLTSVPTLPGITSMESLKEAMPYFELIIESGCSPRARQFLCSLLEPECMPLGTPVTPPCRTVCKAVAEDCNDFILDVLDLSQVFQCDNYPESDGACVNLGKGQRCLSNEMSCGDETCVPHKWRCNGVADCLTGADEANCTTCSNHQFTCASLDRCIPLDWRCDGRFDCPDDSDEKDCEEEEELQSDQSSHLSPCPSGELRCVDGRCITLAQICDGAKDCADGADETNCKIPYS